MNKPLLPCLDRAISMGYSISADAYQYPAYPYKAIMDRGPNDGWYINGTAPSDALVANSHWWEIRWKKPKLLNSVQWRNMNLNGTVSTVAGFQIYTYDVGGRLFPNKISLNQTPVDNFNIIQTFPLIPTISYGVRFYNTGSYNNWSREQAGFCAFQLFGNPNPRIRTHHSRIIISSVSRL